MSDEPRCPTCQTAVAPGAACPRCSGAATQSLPGDAPPSARATPRADGGGTAPRPQAADPAPEPDLPERIGRFQVRGWVGEGSFAEVYQGYDPQLDREVALKVAKPGTLGTARRVQRFLREARAAGNLRHPHIVPLFETGRDGDRHFLVAAFIRGATLGARAAAAGAGGLPLDEAARLVRKLAEALAYAHGQGIVHRDVKPENVMVDEQGEPLLMDFGLAARAEADEGAERLTQQGVAVGTPAYMAPEQARADLAAAVGPAADQYALGCVLYELLTGRTPFGGPPEVQLLLHQTQPPPSPRKVRPEVPRDLETICLKCLEKDPAKRYPDCQALADDLGQYLRNEPIRARPVGPIERAARWVGRHPGRAAVAAAAVLVVGGGTATAFRVQAAFAEQQLAAEKQRQNGQNQARADALVGALSAADTASAGRIVAELAEVTELARPGLVELAAQPIASKPGLHARLALLADEPGRAAELAEYLPTCRPEELLALRDALRPHAAAVAPGLWAILTDRFAPSGKRVRAACALAGLAADDPRWAAAAGRVAGLVTRENPLQAAVWARALEPVRAALVPALLHRYPKSRAWIESGSIAVADLAAEATAFDLTASLLARYTADRPDELAELAMTVDGRHLPLFVDAIQSHRGAVARALEAEVERTPPDGAAAADPGRERLAKRQASAAVVLLRLGRPAKVWPLLRHAPDPRARSYLIHRLSPLGADPDALVRRLDAEDDTSARRALLLALGEFDAVALPAAARAAVLPKVQLLYRDDPDPGLHAAAEWLLRRWGQDDWVRRQADAWARDAARRTRAAAPGARPRWYVNGQGQTFVVVPGPVEFRMGSPETEEGRDGDERPHARKIGRTFAIAAKSVTRSEYGRLTKPDNAAGGEEPAADRPMVKLNWHMAAAYCNALSKAEGIDEGQLCYESTGPQTFRPRANYLGLTGYRLPTEAELEYATRAGATTSRHYGETEELLGQYAWYLGNANGEPQRVGHKKPNDFGLFDAQGNCYTWCHEAYKKDPAGGQLVADVERELDVDDALPRVLRGGAFLNRPSLVRSALRNYEVPTYQTIFSGVRPARTMPVG